MTPQEAKELLPIIEAFANGETIQIQREGRPWEDISEPNFNSLPEQYRIKPKPRLVEITHEDLPPVFWVRYRGNQTCYLVTEVDYQGDIWANGDCIKLSDYEWSPDRKTWQDFTKEVTE